MSTGTKMPRPLKVSPARLDRILRLGVPRNIDFKPTKEHLYVKR